MFFCINTIVHCLICNVIWTMMYRLMCAVCLLSDAFHDNTSQTILHETDTELLCDLEQHDCETWYIKAVY